MTTPAPKPAPTPGYNSRLTIWFATDRHGKPRAYYWQNMAMRAIPLPLGDALIMAAMDTANVTCCHPMREHTCSKEAKQ